MFIVLVTAVIFLLTYLRIFTMHHLSVVCFYFFSYSSCSGQIKKLVLRDIGSVFRVVQRFFISYKLTQQYQIINI